MSLSLRNIVMAMSMLLALVMNMARFRKCRRNMISDDNWLDQQDRVAAEADDLPYSLDFGLILTLDSFMSESDRVERIKSTFPSVKVSDMEGLASFKPLPNMVFRC